MKFDTADRIANECEALARTPAKFRLEVTITFERRDLLERMFREDGYVSDAVRRLLLSGRRVKARIIKGG